MNPSLQGLEVKGLSAVRAGVRVLDDVSLAVDPGEIIAIIGPNGAGKTTLLEAIIGAVPLIAGAVTIGGRPLRGLADRGRVLDFLSGEAEPPSEVRVETLLAEAATQAGLEPMALRPAALGALQTRLGLAPLRGARAGRLSRGERRRVLLYQALASAKPFLLLDEPTGVFDPVQLLDVAALLGEAAARGAGLLVTVHQMSDAEAFATRIVLLCRGRVVATGTLPALQAQARLPAAATLQQVFLTLLGAQQQEQEQDQEREQHDRGPHAPA